MLSIILGTCYLLCPINILKPFMFYHSTLERLIEMCTNTHVSYFWEFMTLRSCRVCYTTGFRITYVFGNSSSVSYCFYLAVITEINTFVIITDIFFSSFLL